MVAPRKALSPGGQILKRLFRPELRLSAVAECSRAAFEECLQYTIAARVAPLWNRVGRLFVQGRDFLTTSTTMKMRATQLRVTAAQDQITWSLGPVLIKMPHVKLAGEYCFAAGY